MIKWPSPRRKVHPTSNYEGSRPNGLQYSFRANGAGHSFTWSPSTFSGSQNQVDHPKLPHEKRRRLNEVQVNVEALGVAKIRLDEDVIFDFTSNHKEVKKQLSNVEGERDDLLRRLDETRKDHEKVLSNVKSERDESIQELKEANENLEKAKQELENAEAELERSSNASFDLSTELSPLISTIRYLRDDHKDQLSTLKKDLQDSEDNHRAVSDSLKTRERELKACRDVYAKLVDGLRESNTKYISENSSLRTKASELQGVLDKQRQNTIIEL
ncbi:hypothetical protein COL516b_006938 [Colletotrichum fioriniae]|nr:uncharacterized protein COL516b_006938 [Colletotrichum fioriniae]KAJ0302892.1 hypothetical protein COL516b_006938 [Colletotrichum fioriniae]